MSYGAIKQHQSILLADAFQLAGSGNQLLSVTTPATKALAVSLAHASAAQTASGTAADGTKDTFRSGHGISDDYHQLPATRCSALL